MIWGLFDNMAYYNNGDKLGDSFFIGNELKQDSLYTKKGLAQMHEPAPWYKR
jgi:hypothetical protein